MSKSSITPESTAKIQKINLISASITHYFMQTHYFSLFFVFMSLHGKGTREVPEENRWFYQQKMRKERLITIARNKGDAKITEKTCKYLQNALSLQMKI